MTKEFIRDDLKAFVVPVNIFEVQDLTMAEQMVYMVLRSFVNPHISTAFPSYETIAKYARMSRRNAIRVVQSLIEKGLLHKEIRFDVSKNRKIRNTSNLYTVVTPRHHPSDTTTPPLVTPRHHPSDTMSPEHNHLTKPVRTKSIEQSQSVETPLPDAIKKAVRQNELTDRLSPISKVYESVKDTTGYSDALFIQTLLKSATLKEAHNKQKNNLAFERYIRKAILTNISEQHAAAVNGTGKKGGLIEDKLPASVQKQLEKEAQGITTTDEKKKLKDYPELQQMLDDLRGKNEA